ncbi:ribosome maturation factor RimP [Bacillus sp. FJAT-28004]|uniref:ribosome maturation factor RimP n=1 Tax=Bacillus sp. FJAT-28004 TaxID=1679165 RepID=UPI0006B6441B|nr:ribosome maturation factor RimP [Bacillus sp. FJAT-28004]
MSTSKIKAAVQEMVLPYLSSNGFELVDIEYVKEGSNYFLRIFVDKEGGIDIDDCGRISEFISEQLDKNDPVTDVYFLEVSSPGAERPLRNEEEVRKAIGKHVYITTYEPISGAKEFEGLLLSFDGENAVVRTAKKEYTIPYAKVAGARLAIVF